MLLDIVHYRRYIHQNAVRDIRHRYAGTGLGLFWHVISPFMQILIYWVVFSSIMPVAIPGMEHVRGAYAVYLSSMLLPWVAFGDALSRGTGSFQENAAYLKRLPLPGHIFVATSVATATLQLGINLAILVVFSLALGWQPAWTWLLLPVICLLLEAMAFGMALILGTLNLFFRDVAQLLIVFLQIWMWSVPIVYTESILPKVIKPLLPYNPPYVFFLAIRNAFFLKILPPPWVWPVMLGWVALFLTVGFLVHWGLRSEVRDVL
jgi:ABC-type polysaccharide/polyol phosphate export permease